MENLEELVNKHMYLVQINVPKFRTLDRNDAISIAMEALERAASKWDISKGLFKSFAAVVIRNQLLTAVQKQKALKRGGNIEHVRLDQCFEDGTKLGDILPDEAAVCPGTTCIRSEQEAEQKAKAFSYLRRLPYVHRIILKLIFNKEKSADEVSALVGIDREEVVRIRDNALEHLRSPALPIKKAKLLREHLTIQEALELRAHRLPTEKTYKRGLGRPPVDATCLEFACALMDDFHCSSRKARTLMLYASKLGYVKTVPHFNSVLNYKSIGFSAQEESKILVRLFLEQ
jgi:RNA polymerase sigma factor (sigma-70 family)